jgi:hypothetical protein
MRLNSRKAGREAARKAAKKKVALVAVALGALALPQALPQAASGSHVRPKGATPVTDSLVLAHQPCTAPNTQHAPPLAFPSCQPAMQSSKFLSVGTPDSNGAMANFIGRAQVITLASPPDVRVRVDLTDVRCLPTNTSPACMVPGAPNAFWGPDYTGQLQVVVGFRLTDHYNDPGTGFTAAGTTALVPLKATVQCASTPTATNIGMPCGVLTTANAVWGAGAVVGGRRMDFEIPQSEPGGGIRIFDGGSSSTAGDPSATLFAQPGVFLP